MIPEKEKYLLRQIYKRVFSLSLLNRYTGHIHQIRFREGHTYGDQTHLLSKEFPNLSKQTKQPEVVKYDLSDPYETQEFPDGLIPGYAGNQNFPSSSSLS